ncbi:nuclease (SNase domain protein) [Geobacter metallireducens RCH3]|nr:thermonuclease family protein [Geobacter metallireducens]EHP85846.1 nuclease (SNase domain protein) [Geobacter metallireducens RCH3]
MKRICGVVLLWIILISLPVWAKEPLRIIEGEVVKVVDGDTITIDSEGTRVKVRLYGIDAPETEKINRKTGVVTKPGQPFGEEAFHALADKVSNKSVRLEVMGIDKYRRSVSFVWLGDRNINREMVREGWSWAFRKYLDRFSAYFLDDEDIARSEKRGIWQDADPEPPWEFRKRTKTSGG